MLDARVLVAIGIALVLVGLAATAWSLRGARRAERVALVTSAVLSVLPGANCGLCGSTSCLATARGMASGRLRADACVAGGPATAGAVQLVLEQAGGAPAAVRGPSRPPA